MLAGVLVVLTACTSPPPRRPNVLLIVADTLRADRLSAKRGDVSLTPFLDELAARGCVFHRAYSASSWTQPSVASLFTSRYPTQHGVVGHASSLAESESTLAEVLRLHGWATAGFSANYLLHRGRGWGQGFQEYTAYYPEHGVRDTGNALPVRADKINAAALEWLDRRPKDEPFFVYLQYMEPHSPYVPPEWALERVGPPPADAPSLGNVNAFARYGNLALEAIDDATLAAIVRHYDASVLALDAALRSLLDALQTRGLLADTLVVVTADHGEEFKEHQLVGHGQTLYETLVRVPLLIVPPSGVDHCQTVETRVSLIDLAPTILDLLALPPAQVFEGRSLAATVSGHPQERDETIVAELLRPKGFPRIARHVHALIEDNRKIITDLDGKEELYDLSTDPGERNPAGVSELDREALQRELTSVVERLGKNAASRPEEKLDEETKRHLEALGYLDPEAGKDGGTR